MDLLKLIEQDKLAEAATSNGVPPECVQNRAAALLEKIRVQAAESSADRNHPEPTTGHRPPGTQEVVASMVTAGQAAEEMDDELFDHLAEAAVGEDEDELSRAQELSVVKARLKSKKCDLATKLVLKRIGKN